MAFPDRPALQPPHFPFAWQAQYTEPPGINLGNTSLRPLPLTGNIRMTVYHSATFSRIDSSVHFIFLLPHHLQYPTLHRMMTLELARPRPLLKKSSCAVCIMCRALVFHLDPAAPVPASAAVDLSAPLITAPLITSQLLITTYHIPTHHSSTSHISLITAPVLITTHHSSTSDRSTSHHNSSQLITSQLITVPLLTPHFSHLPYHITTSHHNLSHPNSSQLHFSHLTYHIRTHHSSTSHT